MMARFFIDPKRFLRGLVRMKFIEPEDVILKEPRVMHRTKALVQHTEADQLARARTSGTQKATAGAAQRKKSRANGTAKKRRKSYEVDV